MKDEQMIRGNIPMTKMEIRATALNYLELYQAKRLLDIGAGTGSVSIEAGLRNPELEIVAVEREPEGASLIRKNAQVQGVKLEVVEAYAPSEGVTGKFDRVFMGGTGQKMAEIFDWLIASHLEEKALVVLTAITLETLNEGLTLLQEKGFQAIEGSQIQASRLDMLGKYHYFKPINPCYILKGVWRP